MKLFMSRSSSNYKYVMLVFFFIIIISSLGVFGYVDSLLDRPVESDEFRGVILGSADGFYGFGHVALLMETDEGWFYFSWHSLKVVFVEVPLYALSSFESFNSWVDENDSLQNYIHDYDSAFFFRGDFSDSINRARELSEEFFVSQDFNVYEQNVSLFEKNPEYNLFFNNCISVVYDVLSRAKINNLLVKDFVREPSFIATLGVKQLEASLSEGDFFYW